MCLVVTANVAAVAREFLFLEFFSKVEILKHFFAFFARKYKFCKRLDVFSLKI
jgi:hypothetical protein